MVDPALSTRKMRAIKEQAERRLYAALPRPWEGVVFKSFSAQKKKIRRVLIKNGSRVRRAGNYPRSGCSPTIHHAPNSEIRDALQPHHEARLAVTDRFYDVVGT